MHTPIMIGYLIFLYTFKTIDLRAFLAIFTLFLKTRATFSIWFINKESTKFPHTAGSVRI